MYGSWFGLTFGVLIVVAALIGLSLLASPLIGVLVALILIGLMVGVFIAGRAGPGGAGSEPTAPSIGDRSAYEGGPAAAPRSGGEPASGAGESGAADTASRP